MNALIWTTEDMAEILRCTAETVEIAARYGRLPGLKYGREWVFPVEATMRVLNGTAIEEMPDRAKRTPAATKVDTTRPAANSGRMKRPRPDLSGLIAALPAKSA